MNWKELATPKNVFVFLIVVYSIVRLEIYFNKEEGHTIEMIQHEREKAQMNESIQVLNNQIHRYEIEILKSHASIDSFSNDQLDSAWTNIFR